jgi:hypothetical protein
VNVTRALVSLYPRAFRERFGREVEEEARAAGWTSWPDLALSIAGLWLHPAAWPARSRAQRLTRATATAFALSLATWYLAHAVLEMDPMLSMGPRRSEVMGYCADTLAIGLVLIVPRPRFAWRGLAAAARQMMRRLAFPVGLAALVVLLANGTADQAEVQRYAPYLISAWWLALALGAIQLCRTIAGVAADLAVPPSVRRLSWGIRVLTAGSATAGCVLLVSSFGGDLVDGVSIVTGVALLLLTSVLVANLRDLSRYRLAG